MQSIIRFLVTRSLVVNLVSVFLLAVGGVTASMFMQVEAFPNVNLDIIQIDMVYPGASPGEVEQLIITPIEQELRALNGIDKMVSMAFPGSGRISMEVDPSASNRDRLTSDISLAIDRATLPGDLPNDPFVTEVDGSVFPILRIAISADRSELELKRLGDKIKEDLLAIKGVAKAEVLSDRKAEYSVEVNPQKLLKARISVDQIVQVLRGWNLNTPGGEIDTPDGQKSVRIVGEFKSVEDAKSIVIRSNARGNSVRLGDVAVIKEALEKPRTLHDVKGEPAVSILLLKKTNADIIETIDRVRPYLEKIPERYGKDITVRPFQDFSKFARMRLGVLTNNGLVGVALVFISLLLFLRFSVAMTSTWGLPIIFMSGIALIYLFGMTLNLISMMGFIMVLGMLVDDAIIIGENITYHMEKGLNPVEAAVKGAVELIGPVTTTILTTIAAFLPLMFMSGIIGKFVIAIPIVVITLLVMSWLESFFMLPSHVAHVTNAHAHPKERAWLIALENAYGWLLEKAVRFRWTTVFLSFAILAGTLYLAKTSLQFQLFPPVSTEEYIVRVTAKPGTSLKQMRKILRNIDIDIRQYVNPEYLQATVLQSGDISMDEGDPLTQRGSRYGQIRAIYTPAVSRPEHDAAEDMSEITVQLKKNHPQLDISSTLISNGPPLGRALEAEISGFDTRASKQAAQQLMDYLTTVEGISTIDSGLKPGDNELHVVLNRQLATYAGIDLEVVSRHVRAATDGLVVSSIRKGTEEIDVTIRFPSDKGDQLAQLKNVLIPNKRGGLVALHKIAELVEVPGFTTIRHKNAVRIVNVVADVDSKVLSSLKLNRLVKDNEAIWLKGVEDKVNVNYGGEQEKNKESFISLLVAFIFALIAIFFILAIQFNNMRYPLLVMMAIPFGAIGVILSFYLHNLFWKPMPLSFFSTMGMVALTGVVVNSSLVLLVFIQRARDEGMEVIEAILTAGRRRLRAVLLTAVTTVVGLLPTAYGWGGLDPFVSPMALALSSGLTFATVITLFTIPATLAAGHDLRAFIRRILRLKVKTV
ncbi:Acriflavin resistance protein [hydrothermal vent metagenome]|uniref:Acriflavin resistance protein n=1 Tax=hydrothermal vent metagenome TaxID=652676 RepID=A0A3B0Y511_9ZZZZ